MTPSLLRTIIALHLLLPLCTTKRAHADDGRYNTPGPEVKSKPPMPTRDVVGLSYAGHVTEVTKDSITIQWDGEEQPKRFEVSAILAAGGYPTKHPPRLDGGPSHTLSPGERYRLADVKVGDRVYIHFSHLDGKDCCNIIRIAKRPGGRVPPLPKGAEQLENRTGWMAIPYHEHMNAFWDLWDKGIPYPEKFGPMRHWPIAPMPRKLTLDGPIISK